MSNGTLQWPHSLTQYWIVVVMVRMSFHLVEQNRLELLLWTMVYCHQKSIVHMVHPFKQHVTSFFCEYIRQITWSEIFPWLINKRKRLRILENQNDPWKFSIGSNSKSNRLNMLWISFNVTFTDERRFSYFSFVYLLDDRSIWTLPDLKLFWKSFEKRRRSSSSQRSGGLGKDMFGDDCAQRMEGSEVNKSLWALEECIRALDRRLLIGDRSKVWTIAMVSWSPTHSNVLIE